MNLAPGRRHVATQRETWLHEGSRWRPWRVDQLRDQRRLIDGKAG